MVATVHNVVHLRQFLEGNLLHVRNRLLFLLLELLKPRIHLVLSGIWYLLWEALELF